MERGNVMTLREALKHFPGLINEYVRITSYEVKRNWDDQTAIDMQFVGDNNYRTKKLKGINCLIND